MSRTDQTWSVEDIKILCELWEHGVITREIAKKVNRHRAAVAKYISRNKETLGLERRSMTQVYRKPNPKSFDELWSGVIPYGHWMITKPWGKKCDVKHVTDS